MSSSCSTTVHHKRPAYIATEEFLDLSPERPVSPDEANQDIKALIQILEQGYAGFIETAKTPTQRLLQNLNTLATGIDKEIGGRDFSRRIDDIFFDFPDGHLIVRSFKDDTLRRRFSNDKKPSVGSNIAEGKISDKCFYYDELNKNGKSLGVIGIPKRFLPPTDPCWAGFEEAVKQAKNLYAVIVDLRGNTGGNGTKG